MNKIFFLFTLFFSFNIRAQEKIIFLHPVFYQQLSSPDKKAFYVLTPHSKYYENSVSLITEHVQCSLSKNQEYYIQMSCEDCNDPECLSHIQNIHSFSLSKDQKIDNNYIIIHEVFDNSHTIKYKEILVNDGLITIPPY